MIWSMQENKEQATGIPTFLQTTVLLKRIHNGPFFAKMRVKSAVDLMSATLRSFPMTTDKDKIIDPVTFRPGIQRMRNASVTGIKEGDLAHMEKLPIKEYFKVNLSEQDPLNPPAVANLQLLSALSQNDPVPASVPPTHAGTLANHNPPLPRALEQTTSTDDHEKSVALDVTPQISDRQDQQSSTLVATSTPETSKTTERIILPAETPLVTNPLQLALEAISKAAKAAKTASEVAQIATKAAQEAFEAVERAAEVLVGAAEQKQA